MGSSSHPRPRPSVELVPLRTRPIQIRPPSALVVVKPRSVELRTPPGRVWFVAANGDVVCASVPPPPGAPGGGPNTVAWRSWARVRYPRTAFAQEAHVRERWPRRIAGFGLAMSTLVAGVGLAAAAIQEPEPSIAASEAGDGARAGIPPGLPTMEFVYPSDTGPQLLPQGVYPASVDPGLVDPGVVDPGLVDPGPADPGTGGTDGGTGDEGGTNNGGTNNGGLPVPMTSSTPTSTVATSPGASGSLTPTPTTSSTPTSSQPWGPPARAVVLNMPVEDLVSVGTEDGLPVSPPDPSRLGVWSGPASTSAPHVLVPGAKHPACDSLTIPHQAPEPPRMLLLSDLENRERRYVLGNSRELPRGAPTEPLEQTLLGKTQAPVELLLASTATTVTVVAATVEVP